MRHSNESLARMDVPVSRKQAAAVAAGRGVEQSRRGLRNARTLYEKWVAQAPALDIVTALRTLAGSDEHVFPVSSPMLCQCLYGDLYRRVAPRHDCHYIRIYAESGVEPPAFVWTDDGCNGDTHPSHRCRTSARARRKRELESGNPRGFDHHVEIEYRIRYGIEKFAAYEGKRAYGKNASEVAFAEVPGIRQLFSVAEASTLFSEAEIRFGRDSKAYVEMAIRDLVARGNRRGLAKAPLAEAIQRLRYDFPNASDAIDEVERAAALARMTPDGWFHMAPLLIWGPPGIGKTAFLQALARCLHVPFRRFDIGTTSMGGQLFGLSLSWATGHMGDIYRLLAESPFLNPVVLLDEIDKASGNDNAPVVPSLLSLLEPETSRTFRDEAIPLAMDASQVVWCASGNDHLLMSEPLRSRFNEVRMERPVGEAAIEVADSIYRSLRKASPWGRFFPESLDRNLALLLASTTPREMSRRLTIAFGQAALNGRTYLKAEDFPPPSKSKRRMGFM